MTEDLLWGFQMLLVGMGVVFALLVLLLLVLYLVGRLDRPAPEPADEGTDAAASARIDLVAAPDGGAAVALDSTGLDADTIAAIAVAVMTHAEHRRRLAAPEVRASAPGSQLFASRWVSVGRSHQTQPFRRN